METRDIRKPRYDFFTIAILIAAFFSYSQLANYILTANFWNFNFYHFRHSSLCKVFYPYALSSYRILVKSHGYYFEESEVTPPGFEANPEIPSNSVFYFVKDLYSEESIFSLKNEDKPFVKKKLDDIIRANNSITIIWTSLILLAIFYIWKRRDFKKRFQEPKKPEPIISQTQGPEPKTFPGGDKVITEEELKPIAGLHFEDFAKDAANLINDAKTYNDFVGNFTTKFFAKSSTKKVKAIIDYLREVRTACETSEQLQEQILRARMVFAHQAKVTLIRLNEEWENERKGRQLEMKRMDAEAEELDFMTRLYKGLDPKNFSETDKMLFHLVRPRVKQRSASSVSPESTSSYSEAVEYGSSEEAMFNEMRRKLYDKILSQKDKELLLMDEQYKQAQTKTEVEQSRGEVAKKDAQKIIKDNE